MRVPDEKITRLKMIELAFGSLPEFKRVYPDNPWLVKALEQATTLAYENPGFVSRETEEHVEDAVRNARAAYHVEQTKEGCSKETDLAKATYAAMAVQYCLKDWVEPSDLEDVRILYKQACSIK